MKYDGWHGMGSVGVWEVWECGSVGVVYLRSTSSTFVPRSRGWTGLRGVVDALSGRSGEAFF